MLKFKDLCPDLVIPEHFQIQETSNEWRIIHSSYVEQINSLLDAKDITKIAGFAGENSEGRGKNPVFNIKSADGKDEQIIIKSARRGGLTGLLLPNLFSNVRRHLNELIVSEKGRSSGAPVPEIIALQIKWVLPFFYKAKIILKKIPDTSTLETVIINLCKEKKNRMALYQYKKKLIASVSNAIRIFHNAGLYHNDLHIRNILIQQGSSGVEFKTYIIDLDKTIYQQPLPFNKKINNLIRLNRSIDKLCFRFPSLPPEADLSRLSGTQGSKKKTASDNISTIITTNDRLSLLKEYFRNEQLARPQKADIINKCARHSQLHQLWWVLWGYR